MLSIISLEPEISGVVVQRIYQKAKNSAFCERLVDENDFETVLAILCCYNYGVNASGKVQKIATD